MASVWVKSIANLPVLSVFLLLVLCLPPGGGQKKKEVTRRPRKCIFQRILLCLSMEITCKLSLPVRVKLGTFSYEGQEVFKRKGTINAFRMM